MPKKDRLTSAEAAWIKETARPPQDRHLFRFYEVGQWLARNPGRLEWDHDEARRIVIDLFDWFERGDFHPSDVLVPVPDSPYFISVRSFLDDAQDAQERNVRTEEIHNLRIVEFLVLRRSALKLYLERSTLEGAPRVLQEWFPGAAPGAHRRALDHTQPSADAFVEQLAEWIFGRHPRDGSTPETRERLTKAARSDQGLLDVTIRGFTEAYQLVYKTKPKHPPHGGWPLNEPYRTRLADEAESKIK
jgi:hypothetical protein